MAKIDLSKLNLKDLVELQQEVTLALPAKAKAERDELRQKLAGMAADAGFLLDDILSPAGARKGRKPGNGTAAVVKYRNPENPDETWSGRGRMANWLKERIAKRGVKLEDFAV